MRRLLFILLFFQYSVLFAETEYQFIDNFIKEQEKKTTGYEYKKPRKVIHGNVVGDKENEILVFYTIEGMHGGNNYSFFLAVFKKKGNSYQHLTHKLIGGKLIRFTEFKEIKNKNIILNTKSYNNGESGKRDPSCCPSIKGLVSYSILNNELIINK